MHKKTFAIILILSLFAVGLTCLSATEESTSAGVTGTPEVTDSQSNAVNTESQVESTENNNETNITNTTGNETDGYPDVVVPTKTEDLQKFNILMNFVSQDGKQYFANQLAEIDKESYKDVITALNNNDMDHLFYYLGQLDQNKIDTFFTTFLKIFDNSKSNSDNSSTTNSNSNSISDTISNILGTSRTEKTVGNQFIKINSKTDSSKYSNEDKMFTFKDKQYRLIDFILSLKNAYENGEISYAEFIQVLEDNGIDTSEIKNDNGIIKWGFLYIIGPATDTNTNSTEPVNSTNSTASNDAESSSSNVDSSTENPTPDSSSVASDVNYTV